MFVTMIKIKYDHIKQTHLIFVFQSNLNTIDKSQIFNETIIDNI